MKVNLRNRAFILCKSYRNLRLQIVEKDEVSYDPTAEQTLFEQNTDINVS